ncbi:TetR/AcrR family transcriptional regulator [Raoultibacter phocaeensis]|uniref:TetR/AcrR family transcriptional regulator n=1 Tax=Raoultibacter phocaeensis TaxID=2479841 RepID=UPI0015D59EFC|nr:TetR/AcrR family transcriptional regulator [Raoultibacter phocaeensis]
MARQTIDRHAIAESAFKLASEKGLSSLGIREVALSCGVSVGTIYNHFPSKPDLVAEVVARFWQNSLSDAACRPERGEDFVAYVERVFEAMHEALAAFRSDWLPEVRALALRGEAVGHERERQVFAHMEEGLATVLADDPCADARRLGCVDAQDLCRFVLESMLDALSEGSQNICVLAALLRAALYEGKGEVA